MKGALISAFAFAELSATIDVLMRKTIGIIYDPDMAITVWTMIRQILCNIEQIKRIVALTGDL